MEIGVQNQLLGFRREGYESVDYVLLKQEFGILPAVTYGEAGHNAHTLSAASQLDPVSIYLAPIANFF